MVRGEKLSKHYGRIKAVDNIDFHIAKGEIIGFLGPNGAGKTTTMNMITGYQAPSDGRVFINGIDIVESPEEAKRLIGYLPEQPPLYLDLTVDEFLSFVSDLKRVPRDSQKESLAKILRIVKIEDVRNRLIRNLSKGYKQRVGLAQALVGNPPLLIFDEPTIGLDPKQIIEIRQLIRDLGREHTVILSSHILPEISVTCSRILIINRGKIVASDTPANLSSRLSGASGATRQKLLVKGNAKEIQCKLKGVSNIGSIDIAPGPEENISVVIAGTEDNDDIRENLFHAMASKNLPILQMGPMDLTLEEIFLNLTTDEENL